MTSINWISVDEELLLFLFPYMFRPRHNPPDWIHTHTHGLFPTVIAVIHKYLRFAHAHFVYSLTERWKVGECSLSFSGFSVGCDLSLLLWTITTFKPAIHGLDRCGGFIYYYSNDRVELIGDDSFLSMCLEILNWQRCSGISGSGLLCSAREFSKKLNLSPDHPTCWDL